MGLLFLGGAYLILVHGTTRLKVASAALIGVLVLMGLIIGLGRSAGPLRGLAESNVMAGRLLSQDLFSGSFQSRMDSMSAGLQGFAERPILGWGPENYLVVYGRFIKADIRLAIPFDQAHNKLVEELATKGALGLIGYLAIWVLIFWVIARRMQGQAPNIQLLTLFMGSALVGYFTLNLFLFDTPATVLQFMIILGFVIHLEARPAEQLAPTSINRRETRPSRSRRRISARDFDVRSTLLTLVALILVSLSIYFLNVRAYNAASALLKVTSSSNSVERALEYFDESISSFGQLANYPRLILFRSLTDNWAALSPREVELALKMIEVEAREAISTEPENWSMYVELAQLYQQASSRDPQYLERAQSYVETAIELAPQRIEVYKARARQHLAEGNISAAKATVSEFLDIAPNQRRKFIDLREEIRTAQGR